MRETYFRPLKGAKKNKWKAFNKRNEVSVIQRNIVITRLTTHIMMDDCEQKKFTAKVT